MQNSAKHRSAAQCSAAKRTVCSSRRTTGCAECVAVQQGATKPTCKSKSALGGFGSFVAPLLEVKRAPAPRVHDVLRATHPPMFFWMLLWAGACSCWVSGGCGVGLGWCLGLPHYQMHARHLPCRLGCRNVPAPAYYFRFSFQLFGGGRGMRVRDIFGAPHVVQ